MNSPPAAQPATQEACGGRPRGSGSGKNPNWARIVNPVLNQSPVIRFKDAVRLVQRGRADWVAWDQIRLNLAPANKRAVACARAWELDYSPRFDRDPITQKLMLFGTNPRGGGGLTAADRCKTRFQAPPKKAPAFDDPRRLVVGDKLYKRNAELRAEELALAPQEYALRMLERAKLKPNDQLFPGCGRGKAGTCAVSERFRCYRWPERTGWF